MQCKYHFNLDLFLECVTATSANNIFICRFLVSLWQKDYLITKFMILD